jgi:hypothetical protein
LSRGPELRLVGEADGLAPPASLLVAGLAAQLLEERAGWSSQRLAATAPVYPSDAVQDLARLPHLSPMPGRYAALPAGLCFVPRFPLRAGTAYTALVDPAWLGRDAACVERLALTVRVPDAPRAEPARVLEIFPTAAEIPANQLRLYIQFSSPMSVGQAARRIRIEDDTGVELATALLPIDPELWDREHTRLTLLFDPGRIKRGLQPHEAESLPLTPGRTIRVVVDPGFLDQDGHALAAGAERRYSVSAVLRGRPDETAWRLEVPRAGTRDSVVVAFDRPLDAALARRCLALSTEAGEPVGGRAVLGAGESQWQFSPQTPWRAGVYRLCIDPMLEDLAGNSLVRVFDRDLEQATDAPRALSAARIERSVHIRP